MSFIADMILGIRDLLFGGLSKGLATGYSWLAGIFPYTAGLALIVALGTPDAVEASQALRYGFFWGPLAAGAAGAAWGTLTGGIGSMMDGLRTRRHNRQLAREQAKEPEPSRPIEIAPSPPAYCPRREPEPELPPVRPAPGPDLSFRDSRPGTRVSQAELAGMVAECQQKGIGGCH